MFNSIWYNLIRHLFFLGHILFILITLLAPFWNTYLSWLQLLVILSWFFNNNNCLITIIEQQLFNITLVEYLGFNNYIRHKYRVPFYHRLILYLFFSYNSLKLLF